MSELLQTCNVNTAKREEILREANPTDFLTYLLYSRSPQGKGIDDPIGWTISRVQDPASKHKAEDYGAFKTLASLPPCELAHLLEQQYAAGQPGSQISPPELPIWRESGMDRLQPEVIQQLASRLGDIQVIGQEPIPKPE